MASLCLSWVFSPVLGGVLAALLFFLLRLTVLRAPNAYKRAFYVLPLFVFLTFFMICIFTIKEGGSRFGWENTPDGKAVWIAAIVGAGTAVLSIGWQLYVVKKKVALDLAEQEAADAASKADVAEAAAPADGEGPGGSGLQLAGRGGRPAATNMHAPTAAKLLPATRCLNSMPHALPSPLPPLPLPPAPPRRRRRQGGRRRGRRRGRGRRHPLQPAAVPQVQDVVRHDPQLQRQHPRRGQD